MAVRLKEAAPTYERLWRATVPAFGRNEFKVDHHLTNKSGDSRRGLTLAFRPCEAVKEAVERFRRELSAAAPGQYFYHPDELHVTVLAIIPGSEDWREKMPHLAACQTIIDPVVRRYRKFTVSFRGVTASPGAVMIQRFPKGDTLAGIRDSLREMLLREGLGDQLDARYKINTAHLTLMRFSHGATDGRRLLDLLEANRTVDFGETEVAGLKLISGDWYASANIVRTVQEYQLAS